MTHSAPGRIEVAPELAEFVERTVTSGDYTSAGEVVDEALRQWQERRDNHGYSLEELRALIQEGIDSGPAVDGPQAIERLRSRYEKRSPESAKR